MYVDVRGCMWMYVDVDICGYVDMWICGYVDMCICHVDLCTPQNRCINSIFVFLHQDGELLEMAHNLQKHEQR